MARRLLILVGVLAVVMGGATGGAQGGKGADQLVAGTGTLICCGQPMVHVNAQSGEGGVDPRGHFWVRYPNGGGDFGGQVLCLNVAANQAGLTGRIERVKVPRPLSGFVMGNYLNIQITDNGSPGTLDLVNFSPGSPTNPGSCPIGANLPISQGNYVVHEKPVLAIAVLEQLLAQFEDAADDPYGSG
jgi:hypothetical protein